MAKKVYEDSYIAAIAAKIREKAGTTTTYNTQQMPSGIDEVYNKGHSVGHSAGKTEGYADGFAAGRAEGYEAGYSEGYAAGLADGTPDEPAYTNVLDTVGYTAGIYLSNGNESTDASAFTTGLIACSPYDTIYLKNVTISETISHGNRIASYDSSKTYISGTTYGITADNALNPTFDSEGNMTSFMVPSHSGIAYIRFSAWYIGEDSIVTVNEPIE